MESRKKSDVWLYFISLFVLLFTLIPLFTLCFYAQPSDNDNWGIFTGFSFMTGYHPQFIEFFKMRGMFNFSYLFYSPLYNQNGVITSSLFTSLLCGYRAFSVFCLVIFSASFAGLFFTVNRFYLRFRKSVALFVFSLLYFLLICALHSVEMAFYEIVSASGYTTGISYFFILLALLIWDYNCGRSIIRRIFIVFFAYASSGTIEVYSFVCGTLIFAFLAYDFYKKRKVNWFYFSVLLLCVVFFVRDFLTVKMWVLPDENGNVGKYKDLTADHTPLQNFIIYVKDFIRSLVFFVKDITEILAYRANVLIVCTVAAWALYKNKINLNFFCVLPYILMIFGVGFIFHLAIPNVFVMARYAWILYVFFFLYFLMLIVSLESALFRFVERKASETAENLYVNVCTGVKSLVQITGAFIQKYLVVLSIAFVFIFSFLCYSYERLSVSSAWHELLDGTVQQYDEELTERYETIFNSSEETVYVDKLSVHPDTLFYTDSPSYSNGTKAYDEFFGKKVRAVEKEKSE